MCTISNQMGPSAEIKGTLELSVDGDSKGSFEVNDEMVDGSIAAIDAGEHTWSAVFKPEGGGEYNANGNFTIDKKFTYITYYGSTSINMGVGESTEVEVDFSANEAGELSYSSSDASVASITKYTYNTYIIQANAAGTATITFSFAGNTNYEAADKRTITVTVESAGPTVIASGDCGTGVTYSLTNDGVLTISGTGAMADYDPVFSALYAPWFSNKAAIRSVVIESGVTSIGKFAFYECSNLASVSIPASVTSIGEAALYQCVALTSVNIPANVTSIGYAAFSGCNNSNFTSITIPAGVTSIGSYAFADCSNLETITLNSNPFIDDHAFDNIKDGATVTMNLPANLADGAKWTTFYNENYRFKADANTQIFKVELSGTTLTMHEVTAKIVYGGTPVVLKTTGDGNPVMTLTTDAVEDTQPNTLSGWAGPGNLAADGNMYVLNYTTTNGVGFYKLKDGKSLGVGKAFLYYNGSGSGAREFFGFGDASGIESVRVNENENGEVYDLQGRRVSQPTKGLYIVNGKKVVIK